jgi:hypothetical protein
LRAGDTIVEMLQGSESQTRAPVSGLSEGLQTGRTHAYQREFRCDKKGIEPDKSQNGTDFYKNVHGLLRRSG